MTNKTKKQNEGDRPCSHMDAYLPSHSRNCSEQNNENKTAKHTPGALCLNCEGLGWIAIPGVLRPGTDWTCPTCGGDGIAKAEGR